MEAKQAENDQAVESEHNLMHELETLSTEANDLKEKLDSAYPLEPEESGSADTTDLSLLMASQAEKSGIDDETSAGNTTKENQGNPSDSLSSAQEISHSDVVLLQTILKAAKGFRNINKRLYKIAETRLTPPSEDSSGNSKKENSEKN